MGTGLNGDWLVGSCDWPVCQCLRDSNTFFSGEAGQPFGRRDEHARSQHDQHPLGGGGKEGGRERNRTLSIETLRALRARRGLDGSWFDEYGLCGQQLENRGHGGKSVC